MASFVDGRDNDDLWFWEGFRIDGDLNPLLPLLLPGISDKPIFFGREGFTIRELHSTDQVLPIKLKRGKPERSIMTQS
jgi:hypothetical protein